MIEEQVIPAVEEQEAELTDAQLVDVYIAAQATMKGAIDAADAVLIAIRKRMVDRGATHLVHPTHNVMLPLGKPSYDVSVLVRLLEREDIPVDMMDKAYIKEHQETVQAKWDGRGLNEIAKLGGEVAEIIADGTFRSSIMPTVKRKESN
jgi:hypothetical protein